MSDLAHRYIRGTVSCACGSEWNWEQDDCSSIVAIVHASMVEDGLVDDTPDFGYYECSHGHAFCGRH